MASIRIEALRSRYGNLPLEELARCLAEDESRLTSRQVQYVIRYRSTDSPAPDHLATCYSLEEVDAYFRSPDAHTVQVIYKLAHLLSPTSEVLNRLQRERNARQHTTIPIDPKGIPLSQVEAKGIPLSQNGPTLGRIHIPQPSEGPKAVKQSPVPIPPRLIHLSEIPRNHLPQELRIPVSQIPLKQSAAEKAGKMNWLRRLLGGKRGATNSKLQCAFCGKKRLTPPAFGIIALEEARAWVRKIAFYCDKCDKVTCDTCAFRAGEAAGKNLLLCQSCGNDIAEEKLPIEKNKPRARQMAVAWWNSYQVSVGVRATGHAICDQCNASILIGGGYLCNPRVIGMFDSPDLICESCFDHLQYEAWDPRRTIGWPMHKKRWWQFWKFRAHPRF